MAYDDDCPARWTSYDRVATAAADLRNMLLEMPVIKSQLRLMLGPQNHDRLREYLDCIDANLKKMGELGMEWFVTALHRTREWEGHPAAEKLDALENAVEAGDINGAWNIAEHWSKVEKDDS